MLKIAKKNKEPNCKVRLNLLILPAASCKNTHGEFYANR